MNRENYDLLIARRVLLLEEGEFERLPFSKLVGVIREYFVEIVLLIKCNFQVNVYKI